MDNREHKYPPISTLTQAVYAPLGRGSLNYI
nr:MAG TPA: hypothetical protein [Caudoviricetes sp.]